MFMRILPSLCGTLDHCAYAPKIKTVVSFSRSSYYVENGALVNSCKFPREFLAGTFVSVATYCRILQEPLCVTQLPKCL